MASLHLLSCYMWAIKKSLAQSENSHQETHERGRSLHTTKLRTKVLAELQTPEVHTQYCQPLRWFYESR